MKSVSVNVANSERKKKNDKVPQKFVCEAIMLSLVRFYPVYVNNLMPNFAVKETGPSSREKTHSAKRNVSRSKLKLNEVCVTLNSSLERQREGKRGCREKQRESE